MTRYGLRVPVFFFCYAPKILVMRPLFVMRRRNIVMRIMKKLAHYKKMGTLQKIERITKKWAHRSSFFNIHCFSSNWMN